MHAYATQVLLISIVEVVVLAGLKLW
jgi:hypothetical protein